jgi:hypothetical protein
VTVLCSRAGLLARRYMAEVDTEGYNYEDEVQEATLPDGRAPPSSVVLGATHTASLTPLRARACVCRTVGVPVLHVRQLRLQVQVRRVRQLQERLQANGNHRLSPFSPLCFNVPLPLARTQRLTGQSRSAPRVRARGYLTWQVASSRKVARHAKGKRVRELTYLNVQSMVIRA